MSDKKKRIVTIDGPSGVGKSTISRAVAERLGFTYLDTGAMYRAVAFHLQDHGIEDSDVKRITAELESISIELHPAEKEGDVLVTLNGVAVGDRIRTPEISMLASRVSALVPVREKLTLMQQRIGEKGKVVAEGRDTGTIVFPDAAYKFYLDATPGERTTRRVRQLRERGEEVDEKELLEMIVARDKHDSEREIAPLTIADDATYVDTTGLDAGRVIETLLSVIAKKNTS